MLIILTKYWNYLNFELLYTYISNIWINPRIDFYINLFEGEMGLWITKK